MKILITGVAGFIGSNLSKCLLQRGHTVIGIDNLNYGFLRNTEAIKNHNNFKFFMGDIANPLILKRILLYTWHRKKYHAIQMPCVPLKKTI